jgi:hypothetical protein
MTDDRACTHLPADPEIYARGSDLANHVDGGFLEEVIRETVGQLREITDTPEADMNERSDLYINARNADLMAGFACADPPDMIFPPDGNFADAKPDFEAEKLVEKVFGALNEFSDMPLAIYKKPSGVGVVSTNTALSNANKLLQNLPEETADRFYADFNRRRLYNLYLPKFEAYYESPGQVRIRKIKADAQLP